MTTQPMSMGRCFTRDSAPFPSKKLSSITAAGMSDMLPPLPSNIEVERAILGAVILDNSALAVVAETLGPEHFSHVLFRRVFTHMLALREKGQPIDLVLLMDSLKIEGEDAACVASLPDGLPKSPTSSTMRGS